MGVQGDSVPLIFQGALPPGRPIRPTFLRMPHPTNLLHPLPGSLNGEQFHRLLTRPGIRIERIVSTGQASPPGFWYDQTDDEYVLLLAGAAGLRFADAAEIHTLRPGDWLEIPARTRHRVEWTSATEPTVWLTVHVPPAG